jgi:hypothetical protein
LDHEGTQTSAGVTSLTAERPRRSPRGRTAASASTRSGRAGRR